LAHKDGSKSGGRSKGTPNKSTAAFKALLERVFDKAVANPRFERRLVAAIVTFSLDTKLLIRLLEYHVGAPTKQVDHTHKHSLASIIAGTARDDDDEAGDA
jgi:hypothetical protein